MIIIAGSETERAQELITFLKNQGYNYLVKVDDTLKKDDTKFYPSFPPSELANWLDKGNNASVTEFIIDFSLSASLQDKLAETCTERFIPYVKIEEKGLKPLSAEPYYFSSLLVNSETPSSALNTSVLTLLSIRKESGFYDLASSHSFITSPTNDTLPLNVLNDYWENLQTLRIQL